MSDSDRDSSSASGAKPAVQRAMTRTQAAANAAAAAVRKAEAGQSAGESVQRAQHAPDRADLRTATGRIGLGGPWRLVATWMPLFLMAFSWFLLRLWPFAGPYPDDTVWFMLEQAGIWPRIVVHSPIWNLLASKVMSLDASLGFARLQALSQFCLAVSVGLVYYVVREFIVATLDRENRTPLRMLLTHAAATVSAIMLMTSPPVWRAAQSPHPSIFGLVLTLGATLLLLRHFATGRYGHFLAWAALAGVAVVECPLALLLLPFWLIFIAAVPFLSVGEPEDAVRGLAMDDAESAPRSHVWGFLLFAVCMCATVYGAARLFMNTPGCQIRGFNGIGKVLEFFAKDYRSVLFSALPPMGWLLVLMVLVLPWLLTNVLAHRAQNGESHFALRFFYFVAGLSAIAQSTGPDKLQVWALLPNMTYRVGGCALASAAAGIAMSVFLQSLVHDRERMVSVRTSGGDAASALAAQANRMSVMTFVSHVVGDVVALVLFSVATVYAFVHCPETGTRRAVDAVRRFCIEMLEYAPTATWFCTDGVLDGSLRLEAWRMGRPLETISLVPGASHWDRVILSRRLPDNDSRNVFKAGSVALVRDWLANNAPVTKTLAAQLGSDLWLGSDAAVVPDRCVFRPATEADAALDKAAAKEQAERELVYWRQWRERFEEAESCDDPLLRARLRAIRYQLALVANETGVAAEDRDDYEAAAEAYLAARDLNPENLSARLNLLAMQARGVNVKGLEVLPDEVRQQLRMLGRTSLINIARIFGTIRSSFVQAQLGVGAARGSAAASQAYLRRAADLLDENEKDRKSAMAARTKALLAAQNLRSGDMRRGRAAYASILEEYPDDGGALLGLAIVETGSRNFAAALDYIERARSAGERAERCDMMRALVFQSSRDHAGAIRTLMPYARRADTSVSMLMLLGQSAIDGRNEVVAGEVREALRSRGEPARAALLHFLALEARARGDFRTAFEHARSAQTLVPGNPMLLRLCLQMGIQLRDFNAIHAHAETVLESDANDIVANYALGMWAFEHKDGPAAVAYFQRCVSHSPKPEPAFVNCLAIAQQMAGQLEAARDTALVATRIAAMRFEVWDTLAEIALGLKDLNLAEKASLQAFLLAPENPEVLLRRIEVTLANGNTAEARTCMTRLNGLLFTPGGDVLRRLNDVRASLDAMPL